MAPDINPSPLSSNPKVAGLAHAGASQALEEPDKQAKIINISFHKSCEIDKKEILLWFLYGKENKVACSIFYEIKTQKRGK